MKGFWFSRTDKRLRHSEGRIAEVGVTDEVLGELKLRANGLHGSKRLIDALGYAPGCILWLCEFEDEIIEGDDKLAARSRTYLAGYDATELLKEFARKCALRVVRLAENYFKTQEDYDLLVEFLKTGKDAYAGAAYAAATAAAYAAATAAAYAAAYAAYAAGAAAYAAADAAAAAAADAAAGAAYAADDAAYDAAYAADDAAYDAAAGANEREWQNKTLTQMVREATGWEV